LKGISARAIDRARLYFNINIFLLLFGENGGLLGFCVDGGASKADRKRSKYSKGKHFQLMKKDVRDIGGNEPKKAI
jgi:hypothetical protein